MIVNLASRVIAGIALAIILLIFLLNQFSIIPIICAVIYIALLLLVFYCIKKCSKNTVTLVSVIVLALYFATLLLFGYSLAVEPAWDFGRIYSGAIDIMTNGKVTHSHQYYLEYPHNFFTTLLLHYWFEIADIFGVAALEAGIFLNCLAIFAGIFVMYVVVKKEYTAHTGLLFLVMAFSFFPLYTYAPIFYTDTLSLPFVAFALYLWQRVKNDEKYKFISLGLLGINAVVGYHIKATVLIIYVAMIILSFTKTSKFKIKEIAVVLVFAIFTSVGYSVFTLSTDFVDRTNIDKYQLPPEHFIMMGLAGNGGYNTEDHEFSTSLADIDERRIENIAEIKNRLSNYGFIGYIEFLADKIAYTWLDGSYFAPLKLSITPVNDTVLSEFFTNSGKNYHIYSGFALSVQLALLMLMLFALKSKNSLLSLIALGVFGLFLFLLFWETRSRYLINYTPIFLALSCGGINTLFIKFFPKQSTKSNCL